MTSAPTSRPCAARSPLSLNTALSGIPWWNTDIGGFHGGDPDDPAYQEVMVRWFQFGALSPLMRLHGFRDPGMPLGPDMTGGPNEVWSYGDRALPILEKYLRLRERLRPYVLDVMRAAHEEGLPVMRPLFLEFPEDAAAWSVDDAYLFGPDLLVAPVLTAGATVRTAYLPAGAWWTDAWTGETYEGGTAVTVDARWTASRCSCGTGRRCPWRSRGRGARWGRAPVTLPLRGTVASVTAVSILFCWTPPMVLRKLALAAGLAAFALYLWGLLHVLGALLEAEDGGAYHRRRGPAVRAAGSTTRRSRASPTTRWPSSRSGSSARRRTAGVTSPTPFPGTSIRRCSPSR